MAATDNSMEAMDLPTLDFEEDEEMDHAAHDKLLRSIYALDGKKRFQNEVRGTAAPSGNLDLVVYTKKDRAKIQPDDLEVKIKRKAPSTLRKPMSELEMERAKRLVAQETMETDVKKWDPVMRDIRAAPQVKYSDRPKGLKMYEVMKPKKFSPRTALEMEIYEALGHSQDTVQPDQELTAAERNALKAMSVKEARERRRELMKHHELLFRMEVKAKRVKKIKSKSFRKFRRRDKIASEKKKLEEMQQNDPEAFMEKMEQLETARMEERLTLKHRGGSKFARTHKAYSKFDVKTREAVQDMLQKNRDLTRKRQAESSDEDVDEETETVTASHLGQSVAMKNDDLGDSSPKSSDLSSKHLEILKAVNKKAGGWLDGPTAFVYRGDEKQEDSQVAGGGTGDGYGSIGYIEESKADPNDSEGQIVPIRKTKIASQSVLDADDDEGGEDDLLMGQKSGLKSKRNDKGEGTTDEKSVHSNRDHDKSVPDEGAKDKRVGLLSSSSKTKNVSKRKHDHEGEDDEEISSGNEEMYKRSGKKKTKKKKNEDESAHSIAISKNNKAVPEITLQPSAQEALDKMEEEEDGMRVTMEELFEDEDVVEQFAKDKQELEEQKRPKKEDTKLPGWGSWSGPDYKNKPQQQKRRKKFTQPQKKKTSHDTMPNVWLNPNRNDALRKFQPKQVPFPYTSVNQYQASLRQPISRGFVREGAFKALNKPEVVTKLGHIIKPLDKDDFFKKKEFDDDIPDNDAKSNKLFKKDANNKSRESSYSGPIKFWNNRKAVK